MISASEEDGYLYEIPISNSRSCGSERRADENLKDVFVAIDSDSYHPSTWAKTSGATMVASLSMTNFGVSAPSLPQVIFSFGTAPE